MILYIAAALIFGAGWYFFTKNIKNEESNYFLSLLMFAASIVFLFLGIGYASIIHSQGAALSAAFLGILLALNSLVMILGSFIQGFMKKRNPSNE